MANEEYQKSYYKSKGLEDQVVAFSVGHNWFDVRRKGRGRKETI